MSQINDSTTALDFEGLLAETGQTDPDTGTHRVKLYREDVSGGACGDQAEGYSLTAIYVADDGAGCAEIVTYVEAYPADKADPEGPLRYGVTQMRTIGEALVEDGEARPDDSADIEYESMGLNDYETLAAAQVKADEIGREDESFAIALRGPEIEKI